MALETTSVEFQHFFYREAKISWTPVNDLSHSGLANDNFDAAAFSTGRYSPAIIEQQKSLRAIEGSVLIYVNTC